MRPNFILAVCLVCLPILGTAVAAPVTYDEAISGDLAGNEAEGPLVTFTLDTGLNVVEGEWGSDTGNPPCTLAGRCLPDFDSFSFNVVDGLQVESIRLILTPQFPDADWLTAFRLCTYSPDGFCTNDFNGVPLFEEITQLDRILSLWEAQMPLANGVFDIAHAFFSADTPNAQAQYRWEILVSVAITNVEIDIKPGSYPNCFNENGHGVVPVAVVGSADFDVSQIDQSTLFFGGLEVRVRGNSNPMCSLTDINDDGTWDMVCQFEDDSNLWAPGDGEATLSGKLLDGTEFEGTDSICIVP